MLNDALGALIAVVLALLVAFPLAKSLKRRPVVFYLIAAAFVALQLGYRYLGSYNPLLQAIVGPLQKGQLACAFLAIVMFTGTLDQTSRLRRHLQPVRAELSILSFILIIGHVLTYLPSYLARLPHVFAASPLVSSSIVVALVLLVIFTILSVMSLKVLRAKIPFKIWKAIQRMSYLMVALLFAHILLVLGRGALIGNGSGTALTSLVVYTAIIALYAVLRIRKAVRDHREQEAAPMADAMGQIA